MMGYGYNMMGSWSGMMIIPIILIVVVIFAVHNQGQNKNFNDTRARDNGLDILNERFARGEIDEEEYTNKQNILKHK
jgi:putative membrane protein